MTPGRPVRPRRAARAGLLLAAVAVATAALPPAVPAAAAPAALVAPSALAAAPPVLAAAPEDDFKWSVVPSSKAGPTGRSRFEYSLKPQEEVADWVAVSNLGKKPLKVNIYATDAVNAPDGGFALLLANQQPKDVGSWITLQVKQYTVPVGKRLDIPFRMKVPANAEPGDHIGGIVASATELTTNAEGQQVNVERRVAARVYLRVDGPLQPVAEITAVDVQYDNPVQPFGGSEMTVTYRVANLGNVRFSGTSRVQVKGPFGVRVGNSEQIDVPELLPDSEIRLTRKVSGVFPAGRLSAEVVVNAQSQTAGQLESLSRSQSLWAMPWLILVVFLVAVAVVVLVWWRRRRARRLAAMPGFDDVDGGTKVAAASKARGVVLAAVAVVSMGAPGAVSMGAPAPSPSGVGIEVSIGPPATPSPTSSPTASPTATASPSESPSESPSPSPSPTDGDGGGGGGDLPRTGLAIGAFVAVGAALVGGGAGLRVVGRRRRADRS